MKKNASMTTSNIKHLLGLTFLNLTGFPQAGAVKYFNHYTKGDLLLTATSSTGLTLTRHRVCGIWLADRSCMSTLIHELLHAVDWATELLIDDDGWFKAAEFRARLAEDLYLFLQGEK